MKNLQNLFCIDPFVLPIHEEPIEDLRKRLAGIRWPETLPGTPWMAGANIDYLQSLCRYWGNEYDWFKHASRLNHIPQYTVTIDDLLFTFWHVKAQSQKKKHIPLLLLHGWPGSQMEFEDVAQLLSNAEDSHEFRISFDLIVPALPGFGFSGKPKVEGWNADRAADAFHQLMTTVLGYSRYGIQGGDWGTLVGTRMAYRHARSVLGLHINMPSAEPPSGVLVDPKWKAHIYLETGYLHLQNTRPDAASIGFSDSPMALAAWILEKFYAWSECGTDLNSIFSFDTLITNLMYYWLPNSAASSARFYYESTHMTPRLLRTAKLNVPTGVAHFPKEPFYAPRSWLEVVYPIVHWTDLPKGGHFPALEQPAMLASDIRKFFALEEIRLLPKIE